MPTFRIETVLSVLGPRYELAPSSEVDNMSQKVLGKSAVEGYTLKAIVDYILLHHPELENFHENGTRIYVKEFGENAKKMIRHYKYLFGKEIELPIQREIREQFFLHMGALNEFQNKYVKEKDVINVESEEEGFTMFFWESPFREAP